MRPFIFISIFLISNCYSQSKQNLTQKAMDSIIEQFYTAFTNIDGEAMANLYHDDIVFEDPAFGELKGERAKNMWRMLCESQKGQDFVVTYSNIKANDSTGSANWEAKYLFSATKKRVHNKISANFKFKDGKIIEHIDTFDLHDWSKQAFGFIGKLFGGTNFFQKKLQKKTNNLLDKYETK